MPGFDRTGPSGEGPMTGRRMGVCAGQERTGMPGRGFGFRFHGRGQGFGRGYMAYPEQSRNNEIADLRERLRQLESVIAGRESNKDN
ncbi:MAG: DUF5320 domain-containing protein [Bacteroidales bacterium]|nr:DUF5320 domain-containing protein [Bacteroidales bacterium]